MDEYEAMLRAQEELAAARMGGFTTTVERNAAIVAAYDKGMNSGQLSRQYRVSRQRIWQILKRAGMASHTKRVPDPATLATVIAEQRIGTLGELSAATGHTPSRLRSSLRRHPEWATIRGQMRLHRIAETRDRLRGDVEIAYRNLCADLGRPATIAEMRTHGIFTTTLFRLYGHNYIRKFREAMGEVS